MSYLENCAALIVGEIGGAVVELIIGGIVISRDAAEFVRKG